MKPRIQSIKTPAGEELVIMSRRQYDALLAQLGDEDAEDRMTLLIAAEARAEMAEPIAAVSRRAMKALEEMTDEEDAALTAAALADPDNQPADNLMRRATTSPIDPSFAPGSFGCHEALHTAAVVMNLVDASLMDHDAIRQRPDWLALAEAAHQSLFDLYQAIGAEHLER